MEIFIQRRKHEFQGKVLQSFFAYASFYGWLNISIRRSFLLFANSHPYWTVLEGVNFLSNFFLEICRLHEVKDERHAEAFWNDVSLAKEDKLPIGERVAAL